jgi:hypothetical protein
MGVLCLPTSWVGLAAARKVERRRVERRPFVTQQTKGLEYVILADLNGEGTMNDRSLGDQR